MNSRNIASLTTSLSSSPLPSALPTCEPAQDGLHCSLLQHVVLRLKSAISWAAQHAVASPRGAALAAESTWPLGTAALFCFQQCSARTRRRCPQSQGAPERSSPAASSRLCAVRAAAQNHPDVLYGVSLVLHAACCTLHVACCTLHAVRTVAHNGPARSALRKTREKRRSHASSPLGALSERTTQSHVD